MKPSFIFITAGQKQYTISEPFCTQGLCCAAFCWQSIPLLQGCRGSASPAAQVRMGHAITATGFLYQTHHSSSVTNLHQDSQNSSITPDKASPQHVYKHKLPHIPTACNNARLSSHIHKSFPSIQTSPWSKCKLLPLTLQDQDSPSVCDTTARLYIPVTCYYSRRWNIQTVLNPEKGICKRALLRSIQRLTCHFLNLAFQILKSSSQVKQFFKKYIR